MLPLKVHLSDLYSTIHSVSSFNLLNYGHLVNKGPDTKNHDIPLQSQHADSFAADKTQKPTNRCIPSSSHPKSLLASKQMVLQSSVDSQPKLSKQQVVVRKDHAPHGYCNNRVTPPKLKGMYHNNQNPKTKS